MSLKCLEVDTTILFLLLWLNPCLGSLALNQAVDELMHSVLNADLLNGAVLTDSSLLEVTVILDFQCMVWCLIVSDDAAQGGSVLTCDGHQTTLEAPGPCCLSILHWSLFTTTQDPQLCSV
jgi:hypothetical protein